MEEIRAEQRAIGLLEQHPCVPAVREVWGLTEAKAVLPCGQHLILCQSARRPDGEVVHAHECTGETTGRLGQWRHLEPLVQCSTLVRIKMAEANPAELRGIEK